jgi:hypothetical protein
MEKKFQKVLQVNLEKFIYYSQKIKKHHGKKFTKTSPVKFRKNIFHKSKN